MFLQEIRKLFEELEFDRANVVRREMKKWEDNAYWYYKAKGTISFESKDVRGFEQVNKI